MEICRGVETQGNAISPSTIKVAPLALCCFNIPEHILSFNLLLYSVFYRAKYILKLSYQQYTMSFNNWLQRKTESWSRSWYMSNTAIQYCSAVCGAMSVSFFLVSFAIAGFIPPPAPSWGAERIAEFYQTHTTRIHAGAAINMIAGGFYLPFSTAISYQIRRIPNIPYIIYQVQLASASAGIWTFMLPGIVLAIASYRPYRPVEITYALNDFFVSNI